MYIYIYIHILRIIRGFWCYKRILSKDNMFLYDNSAFMLYFIYFFFINSIVFYKISYNDVMWRNYDFTYLFTDPDEICTAYVKLNSKHILFVRIFWSTIYFSR